ncbi:MAG: class I SAM-dependent methyltransferase [Candidatus Omnitrophica bacterium]|nr:class I SAM-dependent methyltransferase [Candidatus Omnitrophota bacterium]
MDDIPLLLSDTYPEEVQQLQTKWHFKVCSVEEKTTYALQVEEGRLQLICPQDRGFKPFYVDFSSDVLNYRRKFGGGRRQSIAKAVGLKKGAMPRVLDTTAGFGRDAFILASLGCRVHMLERNPVVAALLEDGLKRASLDSEMETWISQRLSLSCQDILQDQSGLPFSPDVIYLDPMYPPKTKAALVKKDMQILQALVREKTDVDDLFQTVFNMAQDRIVIKRPDYAPYVAAREPDTAIKTKSHRFDIYLRIKS